MKLLYKLSIVSLLLLLIGIIIWCMRKHYVEKFEDNDTKTIISSFSNLVDQMLVRKALKDVDESDDDTNENNSV